MSESESFMAELTRVFEAALSSRNRPGEETLARIVRQARISDNSKHAMLLRMFARVAGAPAFQVIEIAAAVELLRIAYRLHGEGNIGGFEWGKELRTRAGDFAFALAVERLAAVEAKLTGFAARAWGELAGAAVARAHALCDFSLDSEQVLKLASAGLALLMAFSGRAVSSNDAEVSSRLERYGHHLGRAIALADDLAQVESGLSGDAGLSYSASVAAASSEKVRLLLRDLHRFHALSPERRRELAAEIASTRALEQTATALRQEVETAVASLGPLAQRGAGMELAELAKGLGAAKVKEIAA